MTIQDDAGFGCSAFGHLASAFVDAELPRGEMDRFETHLPGCTPCIRLCAQYRAIDVAASPPIPRPTEGDWDAAWSVIRTTIDDDRTRAAQSPAAAVLQWQRKATSRSRVLLPVAAAAAAIMVIGLTLALRKDWSSEGRPEGVASHLPRPVATVAGLTTGGGGDGLSVTCLPGWEPVVWTLGGDEPMTVVQCQPMEI